MGAALRGRSVLLATEQQLDTAIALMDLDGLARRIVLCTPDLTAPQLDAVACAAASDVSIESGSMLRRVRSVSDRYAMAPTLHAGNARRGGVETEWVLLTSGTSGTPKLVVHSLQTLAGPIPRRVGPPAPVVWSTFYDIRRYGGLQIFLRAVFGGVPLVLSDCKESPGEFLERAARARVTHISGTPSHWRRALMSDAGRRFSPEYIRLSGEVADQPLLDSLRAAFPRARIVHAFASTEAGVAFDVEDGQAGFPAAFIDGGVAARPAGIELRVSNGSLHVRSSRNAVRYLGGESPALAGHDGFVDTGDLVELVDGRYYFRGRRGGIINVGGQKVCPEEVESVLNADPRVRMSLVRGRRNAITGAIVVAEVVPVDGVAGWDDPAVGARIVEDLLSACRRALPAHKIPATLRLVPALEFTAGGKLVRPGA